MGCCLRQLLDAAGGGTQGPYWARVRSHGSTWPGSTAAESWCAFMWQAPKLSKFGYKPFGAQFYGVPWHMVDAHERDTFIVADVTAFAPIHPGSELLLADALAAHDATELFDAANHSGRARRLLRNMVVPVDVPGADPLGLCRSMTLWESAQSAVRDWIGRLNARAKIAQRHQL